MIFKLPRYFLIFLLLLNAAIHLPFLNLPPVSRHVWRQTFTLSVARNFYKEEMNVFHPRVNNRGISNGITGMQFPSYEYGLAAIYFITGEHFWVNRLWSLLIFSMGILFAYWWIINLTGSTFKGCIAAWCLTWSPELFYHGFNALPDILALTMALGSLATGYQFLNKKKYLWLLISFGMLLLAGLTKIQFLMAGTIWVVWLFSNDVKYRLLKHEKRFVFLGGLSVISLTLGWYVYARNLIAKTGLADVGLEFRPVDNLQLAFKTIWHNLISDMPELLMGYASFILFLVGIYIIFKENFLFSIKVLPYVLWLIMFIIYYLIELSQMDEHNYYLIVCIPLLILIMISGAKFISDRYRIVLLILMIAQPVLSAIRVIPSRWMNRNNEVQDELYNETSRNRLKYFIPENAKCIAVPDQSGCIWFYFLNKKGYSFGNKEELKVMYNNRPKLESIVNSGIQYLYSNDESISQDEVLEKYIAKSIGKEGNFSVYKLQNKKNN